jgi:hypothetical protein
MSQRPYVLAVEVPDDEQATSLMKLKKENPQAIKEIREAYRQLREIELEKEKAWKKYRENPKKGKRKPPAKRETRLFREVLLDDPKSKLSEKAREILLAEQKLADSTWSEVANQFQPDSLRFIAGDSFEEVIKPSPKIYLKENNRSIWDEWIVCVCSPGETPAEVLEDRSWLLYEKEPGRSQTDKDNSKEPVSTTSRKERLDQIILQFDPPATILYKTLRRSVKDRQEDHEYDYYLLSEPKALKEETLKLFDAEHDKYSPIQRTILERDELYSWVMGQESQSFIGGILQLMVSQKVKCSVTGQN